MADHRGKEIWFVRKEYGYGWTPCTWQGWVATALFVFALLLIGFHLEPMAPMRDVLLQFILPIALLTGAFIRFCYAYGESPRWQWGKK